MTSGTEHPSPPLAHTTIQPDTQLSVLDVRVLWQRRQLLYYFIWRDLKVRYKQTAFGAAWALLQPLAMMVVLTVVFSRIEGIAPPGVPYQVFVLAALVPWTMFAQSVIGSSESVVEAASVIQKVYFPRLLLPAGAIGSYVLDFGIGMAMLAVLMLVMGVVPSLAILSLIPLTLLLVITSMAVGVWLAAVNVRFRDVRYAVPFLVQVWLFASPVAYSAEVIPDQLWFVYHLNPMAGTIEGFRWAIIGGTAAPVAAVALATTVSLALLASGLLYFRRTERTFADII